MNRWALIEGNTVANVVEQDEQPQIGGLWIDITNQNVGPGYSYINNTFEMPAAPAESRVITKIAMLTGRLKTAEFVGILLAAKTDVAVEAWKYVFDSASTIDLDSQNTRDGMALLISKGLLTQQRGDEILNQPIEPSERP